MIRRPCILGVLLVALVLQSASAQAPWHDGFYPYRIPLKLSAPATGQVQLDLPITRIVELLQPVALDPLSERTIAFDRAVLVDRGTGKVVGGFKLVPAGPALDVEGDFAEISKGKPSKWIASLGEAKVGYEDASVGATAFRAIRVESQALVNQGLKQPVKLQPGQHYVLDYRIKASVQSSYPQVALYNPAEWFFAEVPGSYDLKLTPENQWTRQQVLYQADAADCELRIECGFSGVAAMGDIHCRPVNWALVADLPTAADTLDLYLVGLAGHFYVQPTDALIAQTKPARNIAATPADAELADLNPEGVLISPGDNITAWTIPPHLPLKSEKIELTRPRVVEPSAPARPYRVTVMRGQSTTVLLAVETGGTQVTVVDADCTLPVKSSFQRIAALDLFDTYFPQGKRVESRYDPMVEVNFPLTPPDNNGVHVIACTLNAPLDASPGTFNGEIKLTVRTQVPCEQAIILPVELTVLPPEVIPTRHFGTLLGANHLTAYFEKRAPFEHESTTIARFHGYRQENLRDTFISRLSRSDAREPHKAVLVPLAWKYFHTLLDFNIVPHSLNLFSFYDYEIVPQGEGKAPKLSNWDFTAFDKSVEEFAVKRDVRNFVIWHTNGHLMDFFHLADGSVYSTRPKPDSEFEARSWHTLPKDEYLRLLGDYFEAICEHLDKKGLADRAVFVIDESDETTYQLMYDVRMELKSRAHAKKIRWSHTTYKTSIYTQRLPDGRLLMDEVLDLPLPDNDEHFNFTEAEWYSRMKTPEKSRWVYYVETDHLNLDTAGMSTVITPLKLRNIGVHGWYCWSGMYWSIPYKNEDLMGVKYPQGQTVNPWLNPYNNHGHGAVSLFYPPDPRGPVDEPTDRITPSYRLHLIRDGIQDKALLDVLSAGQDDSGATLKVDAAKLNAAEAEFKKLWTVNPVQWYLSHESYRKGRQQLHEACR